MQGKQQDMEVLEGWRAFVEAAGVAKSRIKEADVHEHQQIKLNGKSLQENDQGYCFSLSAAQAATLKARFTKTDEQGAVQSDPLQLGFPLLRVIEGSKTFSFRCFAILCQILGIASSRSRSPYRLSKAPMLRRTLMHSACTWISMFKSLAPSGT